MEHSAAWQAEGFLVCHLKIFPFLRQIHYLACCLKSQGLELKYGHFQASLHPDSH